MGKENLLAGFSFFIGFLALIASIIAIILFLVTGTKGATGATGSAGPKITYKYNISESKSVRGTDDPSSFVSSKIYYLTTSNPGVGFVLKNGSNLMTGDTLTIVNANGSASILITTDSTLGGINKYPSGYDLKIGESVNLTYRASTGLILPFLIPTSSNNIPDDM